MSIVLIRIDDRLIHGQIVEGWLKSIHVNHIVVVSDEVARDKMQQVLLGMAVPSGVKVASYSIENAAKKIRENYFLSDRVLLLLSSPRDVLRLMNAGVEVPSVNVGGMHYTPGKKQLLRNLSVDDDDISALIEISRKGAELEGRVLPSDEKVNILEVLEKETKENK